MGFPAAEATPAIFAAAALAFFEGPFRFPLGITVRFYCYICKVWVNDSSPPNKNLMPGQRNNAGLKMVGVICVGYDAPDNFILS